MKDIENRSFKANYLSSEKFVIFCSREKQFTQHKGWMLFGPADLLWGPKGPVFDKAVITTSSLEQTCVISLDSFSSYFNQL